MGKQSRTFAVIGLGTFGRTVASELARLGNHVVGIDCEERHVKTMADELSATAILDATDEDALREAGVDRYDVALVAIGDIEASILTTMNLKLLGLEAIWVKAMTKTHHRILSKVGANRVILPEQEMGRHIAQMLNNPALRDYVNLGNGYSVFNIVVPERLNGKTMEALGMDEDFEVRLLGVMRGSNFLGPDAPGLMLEHEDRLILLGKRTELWRFGDAL
ncbi:TrkA family potassium uptake protein [Aquicoccus sp. G2-2]|uniref:potassium channel family protein n=1 Tax=Aquicoccus sp. G2-2 TaxID=3092120 RepID=UPI002ADF31EB|nr:TrkA family potassium uptake protein [Aquicoccus sp. G2-2]MEA1112182.1 TrkA family potassium uptake protein [Aquicoccus sp. G2-2]